MKKKPTSLVSMILTFLLLLFLITPPIQAAPSQFITKANTSEKVVALTFDDGSDGTNFNRILSILAKHNIKATFFLTGAGATDHPQSIRDAVNMGHDIGNHSYSHPYFTQISIVEMVNQLTKTDQIIRNLTGVSTKPFFRAPYGATNQTVLQTVGNAGYTYTLHWNIDSIDWTGNLAQDISNRVLKNIVPGTIILMHTGAGASGTPPALEIIIPALKKLGYRFVTLSDLLKVTGNPNVPAPGSGTAYTVRSGDTLYSISFRYGVTVSQLAAHNGITNPNLIHVGQILRIPGTTPPPAANTSTYTVKARDTLYAIALRYKTTVQTLVGINNLANPNVLRIGQVLKVPSQATSPPPATTVLYTVKAGDTLYAIALRYGTTVQRLVTMNQLTNPNLLRVGQVLVIR